MTRAEKCYKHERDMKRGYCEWIPDSFNSYEGNRFVERLIRRTLLPIGENKFINKPLDPTDIKFENWLKEKGIIKNTWGEIND